MDVRLVCSLSAVIALSITIPSPAQPEMLTITSSGGHVEVAASAQHVPQTGITVEAWTYYDPAAFGGGSHPTIVRKNASGESYILRREDTYTTGIRWYYRTAAGLAYIASQLPVPDLTWVHLAGTYDNQVARLYVDGVLAATSSGNGGPLVDTGGALQIAQGQGSSETWKGHVEELRIWSLARGATQIQQSMYQTISSAPDLVSSWHFNGDYHDAAGAHDGNPIGGVSLVPSTAPLAHILLEAPALSPIGTPLVFGITTPQPFQPYIFDVSLAGNYPGLALPPPLVGVFPLEPPFLNIELGILVPGVFIDFWGISDSSYRAFPTLMVPAAPSLTGIDVFGAFLTLDPLGPQGIGAASNGTQTTLQGLPPQVSGVSPSVLIATIPTAIIVTGSWFQPGATLHIDGAAATGVTVVDGSTLTATAPTGQVGPADVTVTNPNGLSGTLLGGVTYVPSLQITQVSPVVALPGAPVTISGAGFQAGLQIYAGPVAVAPTSVSLSQVTFDNPVGVPCGGPLLVVNPNGQWDSAVFNPSPFLTSVSPAVGPAAGGGAILFLGGYFHPGTTVEFAGVPATTTTMTPSLISAIVPPGSPGPATVTISSLTGCSVTTVYLYQ